MGLIRRLRRKLGGLRNPTEAPAAPTNCAASETDHVTATVTWTDNSLNETGFRIYASVNAGSYTAVGNASANAVSFQHTPLTIGSTYQYKVSAFNVQGESAQSSASTIFTSVYHEGYPAFGSSQPNVAMQFLFDEASGDVVDEVAALTCTAHGTPTYSQVFSGNFAGLTPGILFGDGKAFVNAASGVALGTADGVWECWYKATALANGRAWYTSYSDFNTDTKGMQVYYATGNKIAVWLKASDNTLVTSAITVTNPADLADGNVYKIRITITRASVCEVFVNGVSAGSFDIASGLSGKTIPGPATGLNTNDGLGTGQENTTTIAEMRLTVGNATNNSNL